MYGKPYYESKDITLIFRANCINGILHGKGILVWLVPQYGIYNNLPLSECQFENGEIVGVCMHWNLNSIDYEINNGKIKSLEAKNDYFGLRKLMELTEMTYIKGRSDWTIQTTTNRDGKKETSKQKS